MPFAAGAQDARQRTAETIVADALAQLPAQTPKAFDSLMQELAATGADGIRMMAAMLVPAAEGKNAPVEYAINGVVSYVTAAGREELAREIRAGLTDAVAASTDKPNQAFRLSQLQLCATAAEAPVFVKYAADEYLADYAVRGLISTPGTDGEILALIDASPAPDALLAYAAAEKRLATAEPALLKWAADPKAGTPTKEAVYNALAKCGTAASIAPLAAAAKADGYAFTKTDATGAYVALARTARGSRKQQGRRRRQGPAQNRHAAERPGRRSGNSPRHGRQKTDAGTARRAQRRRQGLPLRCARLRECLRRRGALCRPRQEAPVAERRRANGCRKLAGSAPRRIAGQRRDRGHFLGRRGTGPGRHPRRRENRRTGGAQRARRTARRRTCQRGLGSSRGIQRKAQRSVRRSSRRHARHAGQRPETRGKKAHPPRSRQGVRAAELP